MQPQSSCRSMVGLKGYYIESTNLRLLLLFSRSLVYVLECNNKKHFHASCYLNNWLIRDWCDRNFS